jgi:rod shape-determining protein MreD
VTRRIAVLALVLVAAVVLQTSLLPRLAVAGFRPDLLLLVVTVVALHDGPFAGARVGAGAGLVLDLLLTDGPFGLSIIVGVTVGYAVGALRPYVASTSPFAPIGLAAAAGAAGTIVYGLVAALLGDGGADVARILTAALAVGLLNALLFPPLRAVLVRLLARLPLNVATYTS